MAIRYDKKLNNEINKTIRNFNQKIARLEKTQRDLILPERITKKALKESVYNRSELKRKLNELQRYSTRGIEDTITTKTGLKISKYELSNLKRESTRLKRNLTREIKRLEMEKPKIFGKVQTVTFAQMGDIHYLNLKAKREKLTQKDLKKLSIEEYERYKNLVNKISRNNEYMNNTFKQNYLDMLTSIGYYTGYDTEKLEMLTNKIMTLKPNNFLRLFQDEKAIRSILDYYPIFKDIDGGIDIEDIQEDVTDLYDELVDNLDEILKEYA